MSDEDHSRAERAAELRALVIEALPGMLGKQAQIVPSARCDGHAVKFDVAFHATVDLPLGLPAAHVVQALQATALAFLDDIQALRGRVLGELRDGLKEQMKAERAMAVAVVGNTCICKRNDPRYPSTRDNPGEHWLSCPQAKVRRDDV